MGCSRSSLSHPWYDAPSSETASLELHPQFLSSGGRGGSSFSIEDLEICRSIFGCHRGWHVMGPGPGWLTLLWCVGQTHASNSLPIKMPAVPPENAGSNISLQLRWGGVIAQDGEKGPWSLSSVRTLSSPSDGPLWLDGPEDPKVPFSSHYWKFQIWGGQNLHRVQTNSGSSSICY